MGFTLLFCSVMYFYFVETSELFFPLGSAELYIPTSSSKTSQQPLISLPAHYLDNRLLSSNSITYSFLGSNLVKVSNSGSLSFSDNFYNRQHIDISGYLEAKDDYGSRAKTSVRVKLHSEDVNCDNLTRDLCFWTAVTYTVPENCPASELGLLASPYLADICPGYNITYKLLNATDLVFIGPSSSQSNSWSLFTAGPLDRDIEHSRKLHSQTGSILTVHVNCAVAAPSKTTRDELQILKIHLIDINDNPPQSQFSEKVHNVIVDKQISFEKELTKLNKYLIFIDKDSKDVNNYTVKLLEDDLSLFTHSYTLWENDKNGENQTAIHIKLRPVRNARIPDSGYSIVLQVNDTALLPGYGDPTANLTINFLVNETDKLSVGNLRRNLLYPLKAIIFKSAAPLARVVQPSANINITRCRFRLAEDPYNGAFNVTVRGGIVFVQNISELRRTSSAELKIQWKNKTSGEISSDSIKIDLENESNTSCKQIKSNSIRSWSLCAKIDKADECVKTCGLSTGGHASVMQYKRNGNNRCMWRGEKSPGTTETNLYSTCTPDLETCPDRICDELEELHLWICPQDCTRDVYPHGTNANTGRGINKGIGICKCDEVGKCYCHVPSSSEVITITPNISYHIGSVQTASVQSFCGPNCILTAAGGALFLLAMVTVTAACWRRRRAADTERRNRKLVSQVNGTPRNYTETDRSPSIPVTDSFLLNFDMNSSATPGYAVPKIVPMVDSKWEFPREKLRIEQILGEGEFGRVLRAKALEIANLPGYTTVALKTLKEEAQESELADLMSEYQLLKEVSHPNVIRLLGACTLPGGPVYLIIEFAEYGSLRNYLRRSRHLESEGRTPLMHPPICKITPRDILSFAWQISKGMAYLNDMKLVHRDLAARNVLLATDMICKVSDFGLTRDVYEDDTYLKRTKGRVPIKWMAIESLADHIYNSKSDVWSFGVLLWELVTLGASPYPGIAVQNLYQLLKSGYRMEKPENCSAALYKIMGMCWAEDPTERPSFRNLVLKFESMLADGIDYLDLNPRIVHNRTYFSAISDAVLSPDGLEESTGFGPLSQPETVNFLSSQNKTKQVLWKKPESPKASNSSSYANENKTHHYESPIKCRNKSETPTNERPQSYIDMAGASEVQKLLPSKSPDGIISKVTSL